MIQKFLWEAVWIVTSIRPRPKWRRRIRRILKHPRLGPMPPVGRVGTPPFSLELPIDDPGDDRRNIAKLWELAGLEDVAPRAEKGYSMLTSALKKKLVARTKEAKKIARAASAKKKAKLGVKDNREWRSTTTIHRSQMAKAMRKTRAFLKPKPTP